MIPEWEYIGNPDQLLSVRNYRMQGGLADQMRVTTACNQNGLEFTVSPDRCMDIVDLRYRGVNVSYRNLCGIAAPQSGILTGTEWLRSFTGGFLTTCGLDNTGSPCEDNGWTYGLHGRISHIPAEQYQTKVVETTEGLVAQISGEMIQSVLFGEKLKLKRTITMYQKQNRIEIEDEICNCGYQEQEYMVLYHYNIGYPFLAPGCILRIKSNDIQPRNEHARQYLNECLTVTEPSELEEMCYYHQMENHNGISTAGMYQETLQMGLVIRYENQILDHFVQWKNLSKGQYVMGLEPASNYPEGKAVERQRDGIKTLAPGGSIRYQMEIQFVDNLEEFNRSFEE